MSSDSGQQRGGVRSTRSTLAALAVTATAAVLAAPVAASVDVFLTIDGIPGETLDPDFPNAMDVFSFNENFAGAIRGSPGIAAKPASCSGLMMFKSVDKATPLIAEGVMTGKVYKTAVLAYRRSGTQSIVFLTITLNDATIVAAGYSGSNEVPTESLTLTGSSIAIKYTPQDSNGSAGTAIERTVACPR